MTILSNFPFHRRLFRVVPQQRGTSLNPRNNVCGTVQPFRELSFVFAFPGNYPLIICLPFSADGPSRGCPPTGGGRGERVALSLHTSCRWTGPVALNGNVFAEEPPLNQSSDFFFKTLPCPRPPARSKWGEIFKRVKASPPPGWMRK